MTHLVFIHGMYMNAPSWDAWRERAEAAGHTTSAIEWPGHEGSPKDLRANPPEVLKTLTFPELLDQHEREIRAIDGPVTLVGHSIGGLLVQALLARGVGEAGVALCPAPPSGMMSLRADFLRANFPHTNALARRKPLNQSPKRFHYTFGNSLPRAESDALWDALCTPEARGIPLSTLTGGARIDASKVTVPLLVFGGANDHLIPESLARKVAKRYSTAEYRELPGADHLVCSEPGWESLSDAVLEWVAQR